MIIKSMSRKAPTFGQLAAYIARGSDPRTGTVFARNLYASGHDDADVAGQFLDNYRYLPERKNGNALYHEVIVLEPQDHLSKEQVAEALNDLAERYCTKRAPHQLAWGYVHHDTDYPHIHLMISANDVRSDRRIRMDRKYFSNVQKDLEQWRSANLPELKARIIYGKEHQKTSPKQPIQEGEMVRRTGTATNKQQVIERLHPIFECARQLDDLRVLLSQEGFELYQRGKSWGVVDEVSGRRYRLQTLGLAADFQRTSERNEIPFVKEPDRPKKASPDAPEDRAQDLLRKRMTIEARAELDGFDRDGPERD